MSAITKFTRSPRARAAGAALAVGGMLTYVGVAGAAADQTIGIVNEGTGQWDKGHDAALEIGTGDTVTWDFGSTTSHNLISTNTNANDPRWEPVLYPGPEEYQPAVPGSTTRFTFYKSGTYTFECRIHSGAMTGTIEVTGEDQEIPVETSTPTPTPTVTATATATATPTPTPTPVPDDHTHTPAPTPDTDTVKPALSGVKLKGAKRAAKVTFKLSENATVRLQIRKRGAKKVLRSMTLQARAGTRTVVVRSPKLRKGRYTVTLTARDAMGNTSAASTAALRIRK